jgi:hypothetical protein
MTQIAFVVLADTQSIGDLGRVVNAMEGVKESVEAGDDFKLIFDGAGTKWPAKLVDESHDYHELFQDVREHITGACQYCAGAFGVRDTLESEEIPLVDEHDGHPSFRKLVQEGYEVITF